MRIHDIIVKPIITEKALAGTKSSLYVFNVAGDANKNQIKEAIEKLFKVEVSSVKTLIRMGKARRVGRKMKTKQRPDVKRAYVLLKKGKIDIIPSSQ